MIPTLIIILVLLAGLILWPKHGLAARWGEARRLGARVVREDALKHILKSEVNGQVPTLISLAGALQITSGRAADLLAEMEQGGLISYDQERLRLSPPGRELALHVIRAHRLWESYLADQTGVAEAEWHPRAERQEHLLSPQQAEALAAQLGHPTRDPHGDAIPEVNGELATEVGQPLNAAPLNAPVRITHIEDEPDAIYAQLAAEGLRPGMRACVLERRPGQIRFWADGNEHVLAPILANNISVEALPGTQASDLFEEHFLADLQPGERATVLGLSPACRGAERRRLLDLGFVSGTEVEIELLSPMSDPTAYRVRDTVVALRREQAVLIRIARQTPVSA